ncbi:hypothetical protein SanaruYs_25480 [Chryseotalea sanaruensis]|uniref:Outer membrane protein beta-barrel domain-containing protein n=1 Tax=Chryseotalea sanaruensis TaxID=2482724 RepID=A0A401UBR4_9BACT|nr:hypothetical protein [Chryseotalea sanaruensis]GCC52312.1 hypothetical protein SanaruYs_25480 [Chryseotalea sanaruensis]
MRLSLTLIVTFLSINLVFAQREIGEDTGWSLKDRMYVGGGLGMDAGRDFNGYRYFYAQVSPILGYMLTPKLSTGVGINYTYLNYSDLDISTSQYGGNPFLRYNVTNELFALTEYNFISVDPDIFNDNNERVIFERFLVGAGYTQRIGTRGALNFVALYDLKFTNSGPFGSPWVLRVFFSF